MHEDAVKPKRIVFFVMAWLGMLAYFAERWLLGPLIPSLMQVFHADRTSLGLVGSATQWGYMFIPMVAGLISDRFGRRYVILLGVFGFSALTVVCGLVSSINQLFWGRFFTGTMEGFYFVPLAAFTMELFEERPAFFLGLLSSGASLGWFVGPAVSGWLLDFTGTWRAAFLVIGSAGLVLGFLQWWFWPSVALKSRRGLFFDRAILLRGNLLMLFFLALVFTFQCASEFGFTMWFPVYLRTEALLSATTAGLLAGCFGIGQAMGRPILGFVSDRVGYRRVGLSGSVLMGIFFILTLTASRISLWSLFAFTAGFFGSAGSGNVWAFTGLAFASFKGFALGIIVTFAYCLSSLSPVAIGYIGDHYSITAALWTVTVPCAFVAGAALLPTFILKQSQRGQSAGYCKTE